jgi:hypothetical protein
MRLGNAIGDEHKHIAFLIADHLFGQFGSEFFRAG